MARRRKRQKPANASKQPLKNCPECRGTGMRPAPPPPLATMPKNADGSTPRAYTQATAVEPCPCWKTGGQGELDLEGRPVPDHAERAAGERGE